MRGKDKQPRKPRWDRGSLNQGWKGGKRVCKEGYVDVIGAGGGSGKHRREHLLIAERVLGHPLPYGAVVHHIDQDRKNNSNSNLAILPSRSYHVELHRRKRVAEAGGNPFTDRLCRVCKTPKKSDQFYKLKNGFSSECIDCARAIAREFQRKRRGLKERGCKEILS